MPGLRPPMLTFRMRQVLIGVALVLIGVVPAPAGAAGQRGGAGAGRGRANPSLPAIAGRVVDPSGRPVQDAFVTALRPEPPSAPRPFSFVSAQLRAMTGQDGAFRLEGLPQGQFYVVVLPRNPRPDDPSKVNRSGFGNTFYPSASDLAGAKLVPSSIGAEQSIVVTLTEARVSTISGSVINAAGQPVHGGVLGLAHGDGLFGLDSRGFGIWPDGSFRIGGIQPGTYFLQYRESAWPPPPGTIPLVSGAKVIVRDQDVRDVRVTPIAMVRATGRLVIDAATRSRVDPSTVRVGASPISFDGNPGPQRPGTVQSDWTFEFRTWPGPGRLRVMVESGEWAVTAVRRNGVDMTNTAIDFVQGDEVSGLEVHVAIPGGGRRDP